MYACAITHSKQPSYKKIMCCAFSSLCNNWAVIENAVKDNFMAGHRAFTPLENADLNLACSPQHWMRLEFCITAV